MTLLILYLDYRWKDFEDLHPRQTQVQLSVPLIRPDHDLVDSSNSLCLNNCRFFNKDKDIFNFK